MTFTHDFDPRGICRKCWCNADSIKAWRDCIPNRSWLAEEVVRLAAELDALKAANRDLIAVLQSLAKWQEPESVAGTGDFDNGMMCGLEDRGLQTDGYAAMRHGYDRALERVSEEIDGQIEAALAKHAPKP